MEKKSARGRSTRSERPVQIAQDEVPAAAIPVGGKANLKSKASKALETVKNDPRV